MTESTLNKDQMKAVVDTLNNSMEDFNDSVEFEIFINEITGNAFEPEVAHHLFEQWWELHPECRLVADFDYWASWIDLIIDNFLNYNS